MTVLAPASELFSDVKTSAELASRHEALVKASTEATVAGVSGNTYFDGEGAQGAPLVRSKQGTIRKALRDLDVAGVLAKGSAPGVVRDLEAALVASNPAALAKEWNLSNPINTGLVPYDLEAPAKLLTPRPTPLRNSIPRVKGQGASRRFKVISGFTGTGTGGATTLQPGITESTTNVGPGGLAYLRPPYISYAGYDVNIAYVSWGLSDSVSWQSEYQGQGFEDIRSLSNTALLYSTMLMDERLMCYGRGTTGNGYAGPLGTPTITVASVAASATPAGTSSLAATTYYVVAAADAGDLLGTGGTMHQGPTTASASVTVAAGAAIQVNVTADVAGALGYNLFVGTAATGPFYYQGRTGYNTGFITTAVTTTASVSASAADASAIATNFDGLLTNVAASGGYLNRINGKLSSSNPGVEFQTAFAALFDSVKADPDEIWMNGHDRNQESNALLAAGNTNNYTVFLSAPDQAGARIGALVQSIVNQITGKELSFNVHPWFPQGNALIRSKTLPIPDSNVMETSVMAMVQDYIAIQWPAVQFSYDSSVLEIGSMAHYAPAWQALISGIEQNG